MRKRILGMVLCVTMAGFSLAQSQAQSENLSQAPPEQARGTAEKILGFDVAPPTVERTERVRGTMTVQYPTNTSLSYRGVVMANLNAADAADEIVADLGTNGLWVYDSGAWYQISGVNPDSVISATLASLTDDELFADFGSAGLWRWDHAGYPGNWAQMSGVNPQGMFVTDDDDDDASEIHVDFGSLGVWRYDYPDGWSQLSGLNANFGWRMDTGAAGWEEGCWSFPSYGLWRIWWSSGNPAYEQLTGTAVTSDDHASANFNTASAIEETVVDFSSLGMWLLEGASWTQLTAEAPNKVIPVKFVGGTDYELLVDFNNVDGLWWWNYPNSWYKIMDENPDAYAFCEPFDGDGTDGGDEEVAVALTGGGIKKYDYSAGTWSWVANNTNYHCAFMVKGDYFGHGRDSCLAVAFDAGTPAGLWLYDGSTENWTHLTPVVPDSYLY